MNRQHGAETVQSTMNLPLRTLAACACLMTSGCVIVPVSIGTYDEECHIVTHRMELQTVELRQFYGCENQSVRVPQACYVQVLAALGVTAASAVVSGSIMVVGSAAYWAERRLECQGTPVVPMTPLPAASAPASAPDA